MRYHRCARVFAAFAVVVLMPNNFLNERMHKMVSAKHVFEEIGDAGFSQYIKTTDESPILVKQSKYQKIEIHRSNHYGKILVLDGVVQLTERDANSYNEMMAHIAMMDHPSPKRVLVIGGGDGYVVSEVLKHPMVEKVDHVDLDEEVVEVCRKHFPWGGAWEDNRVSLHITDGAAFVRNLPDNSYDVVIQDSSDPTGWDEERGQFELPSSILYTQDHFANVRRVLDKEGVYNIQAESYNFPNDLHSIGVWRKGALEQGFIGAKYGSLTITSYAGGQIGFLLFKKGNVSTNEREVRQRFAELVRNGMTPSFYHPRLQKSSFDLPLWVEKSIYGDDREKVLEDYSSPSESEL